MTVYEYSMLEERTNAHLFSLLENKYINNNKEQERVLPKQNKKLVNFSIARHFGY